MHCFTQAHTHTQVYNTFDVPQQLLHCRYIAPGARHVKRGHSLIVLGPMDNGLATYTLPICSKEQLNHLSAGRFCVTGTLGLCDSVTAPWKVACSKVQRCEAILGADIGVCVCVEESFTVLT